MEAAYHKKQNVIARGCRSAMRHAAISTLAAGYRLNGRFAVLGKQPAVQVLLLHELRKDAEGAFRQLLSRLQESYSFISYSEAIQRIQSGAIDRAYLTFTFDDGLASCRTAGKIMQEYGARGSFFVCPPMLGVKDATLVRDFCTRQLRIAPTDFLSWNEVEDLLDWGHEIGSHTMRHKVMSQVSFAELQEELAASREVLVKRLGRVEHFAWPYGRFEHIDPFTVREVFRAGYASCASGERGCHAPHDAEDVGQICIRRDNCQAGWPLHHILYFLAKASRSPCRPWEVWPQGWPACLAENLAVSA